MDEIWASSTPLPRRYSRNGISDYCRRRDCCGVIQIRRDLYRRLH
ncbi:MAG: hypothetical protein ACLUOF_10970 [Ruminococcus sp.]